MAPTYLGTRPGTQLGVRLGSLGPSADKLLYALTGFSSTSYYATAVGEAGDAAGFGGAVLGVLRPASISRLRVMVSRYTYAPNTGYHFSTSGMHTEVEFGLCPEGSTVYTTVRRPTPPIGCVSLLVYQYTGASNQLRLWTLPGQVASVPFGVFATPPPTEYALGRGAWAANYADAFEAIAHMTWRGVLSDAGVDALYARARQLGDLPTTMDGATVTHKWPDKRALKQLVAPDVLEDQVTRAPIDAMARVGTPTVVTIDPARDGRRTLGATGFSAANYLASAPGKGIRGAPTGLTLLARGRFDAVPTAIAHIVNTYGYNLAGWSLYGASGSVHMYDPNRAVNILTFAIASADVGRDILFGVTWDGTTWRGYRDGVQVTDNVVAPLPSQGTELPMIIGSGNIYPGAAVSASVWAVAGCDQALSAAEMAAVYAGIATTGKLTLPAGKINPHSYDLTEDFLPTESVTATVRDRIGTDHLTHVGTLQLAQRTERTYAWDDKPILHGVRDLSDAAYLESLTGFRGDAAGWWGAILARCDAQGGTAGSRSLVSVAGAGDGWESRTMGVNSTMSCQIASGTGAFVSGPSGAILAADVGKLLLYILTVDPIAGRIRGYYKRAELSAPGQSIVGHTPAVPATPVRIGRHATQAGFGATGMTVLGIAYGTGSIVLADAQALHDAVMAHERMVAMPGRASTVVNIDASGTASGFTRVGAPTSAPVYSRAWAW